MSTIGGGWLNTSSGRRSTVSGGESNIASGNRSAVGGGYGNTASGSYSTVPGGASNNAAGGYSFAAGWNAKASHAGTFVWADAQNADFASTSSNQFLIRASGGVGIGTASPQQVLSISDGLNIDQTNSNDGTVSNALTFGSTSAEGIASKRTAGGNQFGLDFYTGSATRLTILNTGNVGIGTTSPQQALSISDGLNIDQTSSNDGTVSNALTFGSTSGEGIASKRTAGGNQYGLDFYTGSANRLTISNTGNVGIGTVNSVAQLTVYTTSAFTGVTTDNENTTEGSIGLSAFSRSHFGYGVYGNAPNGIGVVGTTIQLLTAGVAGFAPPAGIAVLAGGDFVCLGAKLFRIDHPLDPANKILNHYCTEGPEPLNVYSGTVVISSDGSARVTLPTYFESINKDFRYQLTAVGAAMPNLHIEGEIQGNQFQIGGGAPGKKVSWQVSGTRNDLYMQRTGIAAEVAKTTETRGKYLQPELYNLPPSMGVYWNEVAETQQRPDK